LGEFNGEGKLLNPMDPFLYWYVPIQNVGGWWTSDGIRHSSRTYLDAPHNFAPTIVFGVAQSKDTFLLDGLEMHAAGPVKK